MKIPKYKRIPIHDYIGYEIDTQGNVWSRWKKTRNDKGQLIGAAVSGDFIKITPILDGGGYPMVRLKNKNGQKKWNKLHQLLAKAFIPNPGNFRCVLHKDDNKKNLALNNLYWGDHRQNMADRKRNNPKSWASGSRVNTAKFTDSNVRKMRERWNKNRFNVQKEAKNYGVNKQAIYHILQFKTWKYV